MQWGKFLRLVRISLASAFLGCLKEELVFPAVRSAAKISPPAFTPGDDFAFRLLGLGVDSEMSEDSGTCDRCKAALQPDVRTSESAVQVTALDSDAVDRELPAAGLQGRSEYFFLVIVTDVLLSPDALAEE